MAADPITKTTVSRLLNYDMSDDDDPFQNIEQTLQVRDDKLTPSPRAVKRKADNDKENDILGLDEEVKVTKKRKPIPKLDETRLLSQPGIPKLRALARSGQIAQKLRLKGKGHEFSDAAKLLNYFQLWLDNLYPRAKFADALQLVEKAGHSKRMHIMRKECINEGKPGYSRETHTTERDVDRDENGKTVDVAKAGDTRTTGGNGDAAPQSAQNQQLVSNREDSEALFFPDINKKPVEDDDDAAPEDDELDALLAEQDTSRVSRPKPAEPQSEGEDDLDALLAEQDANSNQPNSNTNKDAIPDEDDDLDALLAEHDASNRRSEGVKAQEQAAEDEDDLDALLAERESRELDGVELIAASSPLPIIDDEDSEPVT